MKTAQHGEWVEAPPVPHSLLYLWWRGLIGGNGVSEERRVEDKRSSMENVWTPVYTLS